MNAESLERLKDKLIDLAIHYGPKMLVGVLFLIAGSLAARWTGNAFGNWLEKRQLEPPLRILLTRLVRLLVFVFFIIMALTQLGVDMLPLVTGLGVAGVGIGLALQGVLQNLVAGLLIIFVKPFRVGEYIELLSVHGEVMSVELFSTTLIHADRSRVVIPNRKIVGEILHNYGRIRQLDLQVNVPYDADLHRALAVVRQVVLANPRVLKENEPVIGITRLADSGISIGIRPWVKLPDYGPAGAEINQAVLDQLRAAGIRTAIPQREVRVINTAA